MDTKKIFPFRSWNKSLSEKSLKIAIVGLGYVGLPTALAFHKAGFMVRGFDTSNEKISLLKNGNSPILDELNQKIPNGSRWLI